ncbi:MAG: polysaccharide pyruvyl transferase family protein [Phycisphaerae bacterium]
MMRVWLTGHFGAGNAGDEALLSAVAAGAPEDASPVVLSAWHGRDRLHGLPCIQEPPLGPEARSYRLVDGAGYWIRRWPRMLGERLRIRGCIHPCGGSLNDHVPGRIVGKLQRVRAWRAFGCRKIGILGAGVDQCSPGADRDALLQLVEAVDHFSVRDTESVDRLVHMGARREKIRAAADLAFALGSRASEVEDRADSLHTATVGVSLRPLYVGAAERTGTAQREQRSRAFQQEARRMLTHLENMVDEVVLVPFSPADVPLLTDLGRICNITVLSHSADPDKLMSIIGGLDLFVGMRFHSLVFSILCGVPSLPVANSTKVQSLGRRLGWDMDPLSVGDGLFLPDQRFSAETVLDHVNIAWNKRNTLRRYSAEIAHESGATASEDIASCWRTVCNGA